MHRFDGIYGRAYDLAHFLRDTLSSLLNFGRAFYKIDWVQHDHTKDKRNWGIEGLRWLPVETMKAIRKDEQIHGFKQEYSDLCSHKDLRGKIVDFEPDEVFFVEWIYNGQGKRGVSPLNELISLSKEHDRFLGYVNLRIDALRHPKNQGYAIERARFTPWEEAKRKNEQSSMKIQDALGVIPNAPMTEYYSMHQFIESRRKTALVREYLLSEFNKQIVYYISRKNSFSEVPIVKLVGYKSLTEIENLFTSFKNKEITAKEVIDAFSYE